MVDNTMFVCPVCNEEVHHCDFFQHLLKHQGAHFEYLRDKTCTQILMQISLTTRYAFEIAEMLCENKHFPTYQINKVTEFVAEVIRIAGYTHRKRVNKQREPIGGALIGKLPSDSELCECIYGLLNDKERQDIGSSYAVYDSDTFSNCPEFFSTGDKVQITRIFTFAAAHHLPYHKGLCRFTHGHEWKLEVTVADYKNPHTEMVLDFSDLKKAVNENIINKLDHNYLNDLMYNPTAENLCEWIWRKLSDVTGYPIYSIKLWESENSFAILDKHNKAGV